MEKIKVCEIVKATGGQLIIGDMNTQISDISTDSRTVGPGILFIPLIGANFDGHDFIGKALEKGAAGFICDRDMQLKDNPCFIIKVSDTLKALQDISTYYRNMFDIPFVSITGSVGKTTTKDMIACVLGKNFNVLKTKGNFNNEIGLPLTVLRLDREHQIAVTELGMSGFGEIRTLASIVRPKTIVITNIGLSHIEKLGSQENILKAKMEIFEKFYEKDLAVLNGDDPLLFALKGKLPFRVLYYGIYNAECDILAKEVHNNGIDGTSFDIDIDGKTYRININIVGVHNVYNALAAIGVGLEYGMGIMQIIEGIGEFKGSNMRMDIFEHKGIKIINDCYNASPASMEAALKVLAQISDATRRIAILGDMLELGDYAENAHSQVGNMVAKNGIDYLWSVGYNGKNVINGAVEGGMPDNTTSFFGSNEEIITSIDEFVNPGDVILVKGSRGMKMEEIVQHLREVV